MMFNVVPLANKDILNIMIGVLGTAWISIIGFYFGNSQGSQQKDILLANSTQIK